MGVVGGEIRNRSGEVVLGAAFVETLFAWASSGTQQASTMSKTAAFLMAGIFGKLRERSWETRLSTFSPEDLIERGIKASGLCQNRER